MPDEKARAKIFGYYAQHLSPDELAILATKSFGISCREIRDVCEDAQWTWMSKVLKQKVKGDVPAFSEYERSLNAWADKRGGILGKLERILNYYDFTFPISDKFVVQLGLMLVENVFQFARLLLEKRFVGPPQRQTVPTAVSVPGNGQNATAPTMQQAAAAQLFRTVIGMIQSALFARYVVPYLMR
eukprot:gnl/MRDRNA2_/MRDRNA2_15014_c0_seq1.p1 gnl/MRDRNA2_/MRDRNA2_15014_c0~~gnl/MRDRNA2_/MRDRNA2_15014_c0_seq1.p1  ORF type:complete len:200 (+),score=27.35 gnl/MRDRNA2_/MRDRNA2_15014_c0_seq1:43-600(+)